MSTNHYAIIEAEDFSIKSNVKVITSSLGFGSQYVQALNGSTASLTTTVAGVPGVYDLVVTYFDENDGNATAAIKVDGVTVDNWTWNKQLGSANATSGTKTTHTIKNVTLDESAVITIEGRKSGGEEWRVDRLMLRPAEDRDLSPGLASFPGAEGFGTETPGGRGGWIVKVTNLNDSGVGSLRWAVTDLTEPRIVVFDVGGQINLKSELLVHGDVTIAGQTAPGEGVTLTGARMQIAGDDVIVRGLKIRPGDGAGMVKEERDAISVGYNKQIVERVVIDHNSFSWSTDEVTAVWEGATDVTYSNNIIAEPLENAGHPQGAHSMGMLIGDGAKRITVVNNLIAHAQYRSPQANDATSVEFINNLIYNSGVTATDGFAGDVRDTTMHVIGNHYLAGPSTATANKAIRFLGETANTAYFVDDNLTWTRTSDSQPDSDAYERRGYPKVSTTTPVFTPSDVEAMAARDVYAHVMANAGARTQGLDPVDARILKTVVDGAGKIIDSPSQVGRHTPPTVYTNLVDSDGDGIPDLYEDLLGYDKFHFNPHDDADSDGYTNIEEYINGLITGFDKPVIVGPQQIEAERMATRSGFVVENNGAASEGRLLRAADGSEARVAHVFQGQAGKHDLVLRYFDETDGAAIMRVLVDGVQVSVWTWSRDTGSALADIASLTERRIAGVTLKTGSTIELVGRADGGEPLRIDRLDITPLFSAAPEPTPPSASPPASAPPVDEVLTISVEAETMTRSGFIVESNGWASGGRMIRAENYGEARASYVYSGAAGARDLTLRYFDESDGAASLRVLVDGAQVDAWTWNRASGSIVVSDASLTERRISAVDLKAGSVIELVGRADAGEPLRIDRLNISAVGEASTEAAPPPPLSTTPVNEGPTTTIEAETMIRSGFIVESNGWASGGRMIRAENTGEARASHIHDGAAGTHDLVLRYFDENDGAASLRVLIDGVEADSWVWDRATADWAVSDATLTERRIYGVKLDAGSVIELVGRANGGEPLRIDRLDIEPSIATGGGRPLPLRYEAEALSSRTGFVIESNGWASGDRMIRAEGAGEARASVAFDGQSGVRDLIIGYFDENDGVARLSVLVGGAEVDNWLWNAPSVENGVSDISTATRRIENVAIKTGDVIELVGLANGGEPLRIDYIDVVPDGWYA